MARRTIRKGFKIFGITRASMRPYATVIDSSCVPRRGSRNAFGVLLEESSSGWRIGYLIVRERAIGTLENHPDSMETFEPVKGRCVMALSPNKDPEKIELFLLDKPIVVKKGVWHGVAALTKRAEVKIFENIDVKTEYQPLKAAITAHKRQALTKDE